MNKIAQQFGQSLQSFVRDEEGAQIIEYALIVAVVSLALIILMQALVTDNGAFNTWITDVKNCLTAGTCSRSGGGAS